MGAAITLLVILTFSVVVVRVAAVALRLTGMPADVARFQARSAFTGTGFTTAEAEAVINHPVRRRVIGLLMLHGNIGLVTVLATFIVSFIATDNSMQAVSRQLFWLLGAIGLLWFIALNRFADQLMCKSIDWLLQRTTSLSRRGPIELLQINDRYRVAEHSVATGNDLDGAELASLGSADQRLLVLGVHHDDGSYSSMPDLGARLVAGDRIVLYGSDEDHRVLQAANDRRRHGQSLRLGITRGND